MQKKVPGWHRIPLSPSKEVVARDVRQFRVASHQPYDLISLIPTTRLVGEKNQRQILDPSIKCEERDDDRAGPRRLMAVM